MDKLKLFDTHTHYDDEKYENADELIQSMLGDNVAGFMAIGCSLERSRKAVAIAEKYGSVYAAVGIHPGDIDGVPADYLSELAEMAKSPKVKAVGEIGLDYSYAGYARETQIKVFEEQLELAASLALPVAVHSRDAGGDTMEILRRHKPRAVAHCYSGSVETALELAEMGIMISFTGVVTFKNAGKATAVCAAVPVEMLMLETDCPYMAPEPFRGKVCISAMAWRTAARIAEIKGLETEELVRICNDNAKQFFGIEF